MQGMAQGTSRRTLPSPLYGCHPCKALCHVSQPLFRVQLLETITDRMDDADALCPCLNSICAISTQYESVLNLLAVDCHAVVKDVVTRQPQHEGLIQVRLPICLSIDL